MNSKLSFVSVCILLFLFGANELSAQDVIHFKSKKDPIQVKVIEIGTGEIKYKLWEEKEDGLVYVVEKTAVTRVEFQNGRTEFFGQETMDMEVYFEGQKTRALKISFLGPMIGFTSFTYEQSIKPGHSWEVKATLPGLGIDPDEDRNVKGFIGSIGYKLLKKPSFVTSDLRRRHILQGGYIKPELFIGHSSFNEYRYFVQGDERKSSTTFGLLLNLGKQWVFGEAFVLDISGGLGFGGGETIRGYYMSSGGNIAGSIAVDIGFVF